MPHRVFAFFSGLTGVRRFLASTANGVFARVSTWLILLFVCICAGGSGSRASTLAELWAGKAHFEQVGEIDWMREPGGVASEDSSWFVVQGNVWFAFSRVALSAPRDHCGPTQLRVVVRQSEDLGRHWSAPAVAVEPGYSPKGDGCAVLDGSSYFDKVTGMWHMLAQCLDQNNQGGWMLCHYTRKSKSPMGRFVPDAANAVVRGGELWSQICANAAGSCPKTTIDEGTPEIIAKTGKKFVVTFHGFDPVSGHGFRGVASTVDFKRWEVNGNGLPGAPILGPADCEKWLKACAGTGAASSVTDKRYIYFLVETMDKSLLCQLGQNWVFQLLRAPRGVLPVSGSNRWKRFSAAPLLTPSFPDMATVCKLQYARWIVHDGRIFIVYEDWLPGRQHVHRRLLELVSGGGAAVRLH